MRSNLSSSSSSSSSSLSFFSLPSRLAAVRVVSDAKAACHRERCTCGGLTCGYRCGGRQTLVSSWAKNSAERRRERSLHEKEIETLGYFYLTRPCAAPRRDFFSSSVNPCAISIYLFIYLCCWSIFFLSFLNYILFKVELVFFFSWMKRWLILIILRLGCSFRVSDKTLYFTVMCVRVVLNEWTLTRG